MKARKFSLEQLKDHVGKMLQWGRADEGAEMTPASSSAASQSSFNGAAPMKARKSFTSEADTLRKRLASMGPRR